jgi:ribokinase
MVLAPRVGEMDLDSRWDVVVIGGANMDYLVHGSHLPRPGETIAGDSYDESPGGKGANQAVAAARLGARVVFIGRVGADRAGDRVRERLQKEGVATHSLRRDGTLPTGVALVMVDASGQKLIMTAPGANVNVSEEDLRMASPVIREGRVLLMQLELSTEVIERAAQIAKGAGRVVMLDAGPARELPDAVLSMLDIVRANAHEAGILTGRAVHNIDDAQTAAEALRKRGVGTAVVSAGEQGDVIVSREGTLRLPWHAVEAKDATGAGDAFSATLAVCRGEGLSWSEAGPCASAAAALKTTRLGAQAGLPQRSELVRFIEARAAAAAR